MKIWSIVKSKWYVLLLVLVLLIVGGGVYRYVYVFPQIQAKQIENAGYEAYYKVCANIISLESDQQLKITQDQAKLMLPLVQTMADNTNGSTRIETAKEIYNILTPEQYSKLLTKQQAENKELGALDRNSKQKTERNNIKDKNVYRGYEGRNSGLTNPMNDALGNTAIKLLTERSAGR